MNNGYNNGFNNQPYDRTNQPQSILTIDLISGEPAVYSFYVAPGVTAFLIDFNAKKFYIKAVDFRGVPQTIRTFAFDEIIQQPQSVIPDQNQGSNIQAQIDELKAIILSMNQSQPTNNPPQNNQKKGGNNR